MVFVKSSSAFMFHARRAALSICMVAGIAALPACTDSDSAKALPPLASTSNPPCRDSTVSFGPLIRHVVVTEISDVTHVTSPGGGPVDTAMRPVRSVVPAVETKGAVDAKFVFAEFAKQAGPDVAQIGETSPLADPSDAVSVGGPGAMVLYEAVRRMEASFTYRCGGVTASGVVSSWGHSRSGILQCDSKKPQTGDVVKEVTALAC
jgi:hypothetical protein